MIIERMQEIKNPLPPLTKKRYDFFCSPCPYYVLPTWFPPLGLSFPDQMYLVHKLHICPCSRMHCMDNTSIFQVHSVQYNICEIPPNFHFFSPMWQGWQLIFADVTSCAFDGVTTVVNEIFFDDVTANRPYTMAAPLLSASIWRRMKVLKVAEIFFLECK